MGIDIRIPIGALFIITGALLLAYGFFTYGNTHIYAPSLNINLNLWWGVVMFLFGGVMLWLVRRSRRSHGGH